MARRIKVQFYALSYLTAQHWAPMRAVMAGLGYVCVLLLTGRLVLAQDTARLFWIDDYKTALHRVDWFAHYGWLRRFFARKPAFDICHDMPPAGLDALDEMLAKRDSPADLRARLYLASHRATQAGSAAKRAAFFDSYRDIAGQITRQIPALSPEPPKHAPAFTQPQARATLQAAARLMQSLDMPWYIVSGTFLGAVREGDFLSHDYDIDIGVHTEDFDHARFVSGLRADPAFCLVHIDDYTDLRDPDLTPVQVPALYKVMHSSGVEVDIFLHHLEDGQRWHGSARHRWWNVAFETTPYDLAGLTVFGPADANTYLRENYGDWRTPKTAFDCSTGTPNVSFNRNLVSIAQFLTQAQAGSAVAQSVLATEGYIQDGKFILPWA
tara:strand:+ start:10115 stop:11260 length:1146 start_codon:yes stop_codon:yes gene_type:complete